MLRPASFKTPEGERYEGERGVLVVPENRNRADSRLIALPVVRIRARNAHPAEPVFNLEGGPGHSNILDKVYDSMRSLLATRDFVMVGYRGVDGSVVLACPEVSEALKGKGDDLLGTESLANLGKAMAASIARLKEEGVDLRGYSIPEVAEDLEAARAALGYDQLDLWSESYGTRVAQIYAELHPERVKRSFMMGVNPPGHFVWEPKIIDAQIEQYSRLWAQDPECSKRCPDLAGAMRRVAHHMPRRWLAFPIDPGKVRLATFFFLHQRTTAAKVFDAYVAADHGDASGLALMSMTSNFFLPKLGVWGDFFSKGLMDRDPGRNYATEMDPPDAILGSPGSLLYFGPTTALNPWPAAPIPEELRRVRPSKVETLLVGGNLDFSTPAEAATKELLPYLSHGNQVVLSDMGHLEYNQPEVFEKLVVGFYDTGKADASAFIHAPMDFHVTWRLPTLAKLALAGGLCLVLLAGSLTWLLFRCLRRKKFAKNNAKEHRGLPGSVTF